jgi:hypothetical protein
MDFWYAAPYLQCRGCYAAFPLPYGLMPSLEELDQAFEQEENSPLVMPPDGWSATFGCIKCGFVATYDNLQVEERCDPHKIAGGCHDDSVCFSVEFPCANIRCKAPSKILVDMNDEGFETELRRLLKAGKFVGDLPCGHSCVLPSREENYRVQRIVTRLW